MLLPVNHEGGQFAEGVVIPGEPTANGVVVSDPSP